MSATKALERKNCVRRGVEALQRRVQEAGVPEVVEPDEPVPAAHGVQRGRARCLVLLVGLKRAPGPGAREGRRRLDSSAR